MRAKASELREAMAQTLEELRRLSMDLRPAALDDLGLVPALEWYTRELERTAGFSVETTITGLGQRLARPIEVEFYRIIQEALTNISKHARAKRVKLHLAVEDGVATLGLEDDGVGFDATATLTNPSRGLGLLGMRERVELVGGNFHIDSMPGGGTRIRITVPLPREAPA